MKKWTQKQIEILKDNYPKHGAQHVAALLDRTEHSVFVKASRLGCNVARHEFDRCYFDCIDNAEKAYWLGFIAADGYVQHSISGRRYALGIQLAQTDAQHLNKFKCALNSDAELKYRVRSLQTRDYTAKAFTMVSIRLHSKHLVETLQKYGIIPNKTAYLKIKGVPEQYIWDYVRGYFDGDGFFSCTKIKKDGRVKYVYGRVGFVCHTKEFLEQVQSILHQKNITSYIRADRGNWILQIRKSESVQKFCESIYSDRYSTHLDRKYFKYKSFYNI